MNPETGKRLDDRLKMKSYIGMKKIFAIVALLMVSVTLTARQKPADQEKQQPQEQEQAMVQRLYETQVSGSDSDFYEAFGHYFAKYDSIRQNLPEQFNAANLEQVMVCHCLIQKDYQCALAWCDSIDVPLTATELRINVYEQMGDWQRTYALRNESTARYS